MIGSKLNKRGVRSELRKKGKSGSGKRASNKEGKMHNQAGARLEHQRSFCKKGVPQVDNTSML
jgi:hypothetical protein